MTIARVFGHTTDMRESVLVNCAISAMLLLGLGGGCSDSSGDDGGPNWPPVGACDGLPPPGVWERITPPGGDRYDPPVDPMDGYWGNHIYDVELRPDTMRVYASLFHSGEYYSDDCGANWTSSSGLPVADLTADHPDWSGVSARLHIDPEQPDIMYKHVFQGAIWKSIDAGKTWIEWGPKDLYKYFLWGFINNLHQDPTDNKHWIVSSHTQCLDRDLDGNFDEDDDTWACLIETKDGGDSWHLVSAAVTWAEGSGVAIIDDNNWVFGTGTIGGGLYQTFDGGKNWVTQRPQDDGGFYPAVYKSPTTGRYFMTSVYHGVLQSEDGHTWTEIPGSPSNCPVIMGTGKTLICSNQWHRDGIFIADEADPTTWRAIDPPMPAMPPSCTGEECEADTSENGAADLAYDPQRHVLYVPRGRAGLWRIVFD
jgi:hypothetical protein